jgi:hypothetical protein
MLIIKSFLKKPHKNIYDLDEADRKPSDFFIDIDDTAQIQKLRKKFDDFYLYGALIIKYKGRNILSFRHYDLIDQLLIYFLNMLDDLQTKNLSEYSFPDQPLDMTIRRVNNHTFNITFDASKWIEFNVPEYEFVRALLDEEQHFFTTIIPLLNLSPEHASTLERIKRLRAIYDHDA